MQLGVGTSGTSAPWPETKARSQRCEQETPATRPEGPGLLALPKRIPAKMKSSETRKVFTGRKRSIVCVARHTHASSERGFLSPPRGN